MYRSVFISDLHLGSKHCQDEALLKFLQELKTEKLYLVGDIVDGWRLQKKWYWPNSHNKVIKEIIKLSKNTKVFWISGNHDEFLRHHNFGNIGNVEICNHTVYQAIDGRNFLVTHGDMFDYLMRTKWGRFIMHIGDLAYDSLISLNTFVNWTRKLVGKKYWSLSKYLKVKAKAASNFVGDFEEEMIKYCKKRKFDGIICGHIHQPRIREMDGITYMNDGDWVENCSALIETSSGEWKIKYYV